jgi:hypothetical protein
MPRFLGWCRRNPDRAVAVLAFCFTAITATGCGNPIACYSYPMTDVTVPVAALPEPADAGSADGGVQGLVDACQTTPSPYGACRMLCELVVGPKNSMFIRTCELTTADGGAAVHVIAAGYCAV